ncbi:hypothetical protein L1987_38193 [Smallanthus sonchifolius]|uniref:Uncharacterized protein n=1 Tax=Smallanthus sonchifolius TaxID=185202 RepID=A0ACB9HJE8_9ASTR|nr:hypothetical protein L1987_38193 [Smallanthus sonchifolius]
MQSFSVMGQEDMAQFCVDYYIPLPLHPTLSESDQLIHPFLPGMFDMKLAELLRKRSLRSVTYSGGTAGVKVRKEMEAYAGETEKPLTHKR